MRKSKIVIPHEHGGWAMITVPFLFGMAAGETRWMHALLFLAWLFIYLSSYPLLQSMKKHADKKRLYRWGAGYGLIAIACLVAPVIDTPSLAYFGAPLVLLLVVNIWHAKHRSERAVINDMCAIVTFSIGAAAAYRLGGGQWDWVMAELVLFNFLYFMGSVFFVKSVFRERTNKRWIAYARIYHTAAPFIPIVIGFPYVAAAFLFSSIRTFMFAGKQMRPMKVGIIEIVGSVVFAILSAVTIRMYI
jgi:hypothetical protein